MRMQAGNYSRIVLLIGVIVLLASSNSAAASHFTGSCSIELNVLEEAIEDSVFLGRNAGTSESNLLAKLAAAAAKLALGKLDGAVDKLSDISEKATALATANKPKLEDATAINQAVVDAIACVVP